MDRKERGLDRGLTYVVSQALPHVLEVGGSELRERVHLEPGNFFGDETVVCGRRIGEKGEGCSTGGQD